MRTAKVHPYNNEDPTFEQKITEMGNNARSGIIRDGRTRVYTKRMGDSHTSPTNSSSNFGQQPATLPISENNSEIKMNDGKIGPESEDFELTTTNNHDSVGQKSNNITHHSNSTTVVILINDKNEDKRSSNGTTPFGTGSNNDTNMANKNTIVFNNGQGVDGTDMGDSSKTGATSNTGLNDPTRSGNGGQRGQQIQELEVQKPEEKIEYTQEDWNRYTWKVFALLFLQSVIAAASSMIFYYRDEPQKFIEENQWTFYVIWILFISSVIFCLTSFRMGGTMFPPFIQVILFSALLGIALGFLTGSVKTLFVAKTCISVAVGCFAIFLLTLLTRLNFKSIFTYGAGLVGVGASIVIHIFFDEPKLINKILPTLAALAYVWYLLGGLCLLSSSVGIDPTSYYASSIAAHFSIVFVILKIIGV